MEIVLALFSWTFSIALGLTILSAPIDLLLRKFKKGWKGSKAEDVYKNVQFVLLALTVFTLLITVVLMTGSY